MKIEFHGAWPTSFQYTESGHAKTSHSKRSPIFMWHWLYLQGERKVTKLRFQRLVPQSYLVWHHDIINTLFWSVWHHNVIRLLRKHASVPETWFGKGVGASRSLPKSFVQLDIRVGTPNWERCIDPPRHSGIGPKWPKSRPRTPEIWHKWPKSRPRIPQKAQIQAQDP